MRAGPEEKRHLKVDMFLATPDTVDYDTLCRGIAAVKAAGLEYTQDTADVLRKGAGANYADDATQ